MKEKGTTLWNQAWWYRETLLLMMFALYASIKQQFSCLRLHYCSCYPMIVTYQFSKSKWNNIAITSPALYVGFLFFSPLQVFAMKCRNFSSSCVVLYQLLSWYKPRKGVDLKHPSLLHTRNCSYHAHACKVLCVIQKWEDYLSWVEFWVELCLLLYVPQWQTTVWLKFGEQLGKIKDLQPNRYTK